MRRIKLVVTATVVAVAGAVTAGVAWGSSADAGSAPRHGPYVLLTSGVYQGASWHLYAWQQDGHLCMELDSAGSDPSHKSVSGDGAAGAGGCEFDRRYPDSGYYVGGPGVAGSTAAFGPLPSGATQIRVATGETLPTAALPTGVSLPAGRYWVNVTAAGWPSAADGTVLDTPQPLDARGEPVGFQAF